MVRRKKTVAASAGQPPGTLIHVGERRTEAARLHIIDYDRSSIMEIDPQSVDECGQFKTRKSVTWLNIDGLHDTALLEEIGRQYDVHPLVLEDIANTEQRPKTEFYDSGLVFITLRMFYAEPTGETGDFRAEQVSVLFGESFVLSFQEQPGDVFDPVRERLRTGKGRIRRMGADYLAYSLIDAIVDNYFVLLEDFGEVVESLENRIVERSDAPSVAAVHQLKRRLITIRRAVWPLRELIGVLIREESDLIAESTGPFLRDLYDHSVQVMDTVESYRDIVSGLMDLYMSSVSNRMNEVMKVLTIIATIFIPLTFIAGVYGMNFNPEVSWLNMPELNWSWGYPAALGAMVLVAVVMIIFFKRRKWL